MNVRHSVQLRISTKYLTISLRCFNPIFPNMIIKHTMIFKYQLAFLIITKLLVSGEWIEMPEFSDKAKVYKLSVNSHNSFDNKFTSTDQKTALDYDIKTINQVLNKYGNTDTNTSREISVSGTGNSVHFFKEAAINPSNLSEEATDIYVNDYDDIPTENLNLKEALVIHTDTSTPAIPSNLQLPTEELSISSTALPILPVEKSQVLLSDKETYINETTKGLGFQDYLPMEILKNVHQTLKSQPSTLKGKIRFLKQFEKDLIANIETRLSKALAPSRQARGAHDYYDDEDEMGFPSLEGALMAISFLTFAVYLVRLIMLLFRNANNSTANATILFGRNRRSTDTLNNKTREILDYLDTFNRN